MDTTIKRGAAAQPPRLIVYGTEGIGKTTLGAGFPAPIFIQTEDGLGRLDADTFGLCQSWQDVKDCLAAVLAEPQGAHRTLVVDSLDWLEKLIWRDTCEQGGKQNIEDFGFAKGYIYALTRWDEFLTRLDEIRAAKRMAILLLAHHTVASVKNPNGEDYNAFAPRLHNKAAGVVCQWADAIGFAHLRMHVDTAKKKAIGLGEDANGDRVATWIGSPGLTAKNRFGMPQELPLSFEALAPFIAPAHAAKLAQAAAERIDERVQQGPPPEVLKPHPEISDNNNNAN